MPKLLCKCGETLSLSEVPSPIGFHLISERDLDKIAEDTVEFEVLAKNMLESYLCPNCGRLHVFGQT